MNLDTPGGQRIIYENNKLKRNDSNTSLKRRDSDSTNSYTAPQEKSPRPTSLFRMGGKLFQDGTSREHSKKNIQENRVQSMSTTTGRNGLFATAPTGSTYELCILYSTSLSTFTFTLFLYCALHFFLFVCMPFSLSLSLSLSISQFSPSYTLILFVPFLFSLSLTLSTLPLSPSLSYYLSPLSLPLSVSVTRSQSLFTSILPQRKELV